VSSATQTQSRPGEQWRGVLEEPGEEAERLTPASRHGSRRLLGDLLLPHRARVALVVAVVLVENAARLSLPWLVALGIDRGLPPIIGGESARTLLQIVAAMVVAVVLQSLGRICFLRISGRIGQDVLLTCSRTSSGSTWPSTTATPRAASRPG
jgi:hypothetical protein